MTFNVHRGRLDVEDGFALDRDADVAERVVAALRSGGRGRRSGSAGSGSPTDSCGSEIAKGRPGPDEERLAP